MYESLDNSRVKLAFFRKNHVRNLRQKWCTKLNIFHVINCNVVLKITKIVEILIKKIMANQNNLWKRNLISIVKELLKYFKQLKQAEAD